MHENFLKKSFGTFVEFGARDGIEHSNTYFFESLGWRGILIEAMPHEYANLIKNRNALTLNAALCSKPGVSEFLKSKYEGWHGLADSYPSFRKNSQVETFQVPCYTLDSVIEKSGFKQIDYMTVDTEGSEFDILEHFPFHKYVINYIQIEILVSEKEKYEKIHTLMKKNGYRLVIDYVVAVGDTIDSIFERTNAADLIRFNEIKANGFNL